MMGFIVMIVIMGLGIYFRTKFDREYTMPTIKENADLSLLYKVCLGLLAVAIIGLFTNFKAFAFWLLIIMIPFVLYFNLKTYGIALGKFFKNKR